MFNQAVRRIFSSFTLGLLFSSVLYSKGVIASPPESAQTITGTVASVGDGDTIRVKTSDRILTIRLACIDTPEMKQQPYGAAAASRLKQLLPIGRPVSLMIGGKDVHGRTVAKVFAGNTSINLSLVQEGQAAIYPQYLNECPELRDRLLSAEASAKALRLGFWAQTNPVMPWDFRRSHSSQSNATSQSQKPKSNSLPLRSPVSRPAPSRDYNCSDFKTQAEAQQMFNAYPGDPFQLDLDRDRIACESLRK
jgi:micrococcal nuclease